MKKISPLLFAVALLLGCNLPAQTVVTTNASGGTTTTTNSISQDAWKIVDDGYAVLKNLSFTNGFVAEPFGIYHKGDWGGGIAVSTANTNGINYGFFLAAIQETVNGQRTLDFYDGGVAISATGSYDIPLIGSCLATAEVGAATDLSNPQTVYNQDIACVKKVIYDNGNFSVALGGGMGYMTRWNDSFDVGFVNLTDRLKGSGFLGLW